jgi:hypothetical protein
MGCETSRLPRFLNRLTGGREAVSLSAAVGSGRLDLASGCVSHGSTSAETGDSHFNLQAPLAVCRSRSR